jgi:hypothetical protein
VRIERANRQTRTRAEFARIREAQAASHLAEHSAARQPSARPPRPRAEHQAVRDAARLLSGTAPPHGYRSIGSTWILTRQTAR